MFEVLGFIIKCIGQFIAMLFTIDIGPMSLGLFMCVVFIGFPMFLFFVSYLKTSFLDEFDERYDMERPMETWHFSEKSTTNYGNGYSYTARHNLHWKSRYNSRRYK